MKTAGNRLKKDENRRTVDDLSYRLFRFEGFTLDVLRRVLRNGERELELRPKSFDVLCCLVERAGQPVTKEEIIDTVWPNVVVGDDSLARCVSDVRQALGDHGQRIIKTLPRRGYVFAAPVSRAASDGPFVSRADAAPRAAPKSRPRWPYLAGAAFLLIAVIGAWVGLRPSGVQLSDRPSIAVLPFDNLSGDPQQDYFSDGIAEDLATSLSKFNELVVIAYDSSSKLKGKPEAAQRIGQQLGARYLLTGTTRRDPERIRVTAQLVDTANGVQLWSERYDAGRSGFFSVQDEIVKHIATTLVARVSVSELDRALRKAPADLAAHDYALRANALMHETSPAKHGETIAAARVLYEQALARDARYAPALQGLALTYLRSWLHPSPGHPVGGEFQQQATLDRAEALARNAVAIDNNLAKARATLGWILYWQGRPEEGMREFERAFESNPNYVDGRFGGLLVHNGRAPEAIEYLKRVMRLDPFYSPICTYYLGMAHFFVGRYEEADELMRSVSARMPDKRPKVLLAAISAHQGHGDRARAAAAEVLRADPQFSIARELKALRITKADYVEHLASGLRKAGLPD